MGARLNDGGKAMTKDEIMQITDRADGALQSPQIWIYLERKINYGC